MHDLHLFSVSESALRGDISNDQIDIPGYITVRNDLPENYRNGGVLIYYRADIGVKHRLDLQNHSNTLVLELSLSRKKVFFVLVYRKFSQSPDEFKTYIEKLDDLFQKIGVERPYCLVTCGYFNAHSRDWWQGDKTDNFGISIQKLFDDHLLTQTVNQPTYLTRNSQTCIDLVATDQPNLILSNEIHPSLHTNCHHQVNFVKMNLKCPPLPPNECIVWHYGRANNESIQRSLIEFNWEEALSNLESNPDEQIELFDNVLKYVAENFIPFDDKLIRPRDPPGLQKIPKHCTTNTQENTNNLLRMVVGRLTNCTLTP